MTIGPVQLLVLGFQQPNFEGKVLAEFDRLRDNDLVRVVDALVVWKDTEGKLTKLQTSQLSTEEQAEFGAVVGALVGFGADGVEGAEQGAELGQQAVEERGGVFDEEEWDVLAEIPEDSAAALVMLEHRWAIPLRDALVSAGGTRLASEFISPLDLIALGMVSAAEAETLATAGQDSL